MKIKRIDFMIFVSAIISLLTIALTITIFYSSSIGRINEISYILLMGYFGAILGYMLSRLLRHKK